MSKEKYVAYISSYTQGDSHGIRIYDVDMKNGRFKEKDKVEITNSSYLTISHNGKFLYSITDFGVEAYTILPGNIRKYFLGGSSMKSSLSIYSSLPKGTSRLPRASFSGLLTTGSISVCPSG